MGGEPKLHYVFKYITPKQLIIALFSFNLKKQSLLKELSVRPVKNIEHILNIAAYIIVQSMKLSCQLDKLFNALLTDARDKMDSILSSESAWTELGGSDDIKITEAAEAFLTLLSTMTERYSVLPQPGHRYDLCFLFYKPFRNNNKWNNSNNQLQIKTFLCTRLA